MMQAGLEQLLGARGHAEEYARRTWYENVELALRRESCTGIATVAACGLHTVVNGG
jgi:hypothetical protein